MLRVSPHVNSDPIFAAASLKDDFPVFVRDRGITFWQTRSHRLLRPTDQAILLLVTFGLSLARPNEFEFVHRSPLLRVSHLVFDRRSIGLTTLSSPTWAVVMRPRASPMRLMTCPTNAGLEGHLVILTLGGVSSCASCSSPP